MLPMPGVLAEHPAVTGDEAVAGIVLGEAEGRTGGCVELSFDAFDVQLDFDAGTATVVDVLEHREPATTDLARFLARAASFGDDPSSSAGQAMRQRRPVRFRADADGGVERLHDGSP
jgi:hypothetical protein